MAARCGQGPLSEALDYVLSLKPGQIKPVNIEKTGCSAKLAWIAPYQGGSPITEWKVEIKNKKGKFVNLLQCKTKLQFCEVPMETLASEPYGLIPGDEIIAIVSAKNSFGFGPASLPNANPI